MENLENDRENLKKHGLMTKIRWSEIMGVKREICFEKDVIQKSSTNFFRPPKLGARSPPMCKYHGRNQKE